MAVMPEIVTTFWNPPRWDIVYQDRSGLYRTVLPDYLWRALPDKTHTQQETTQMQTLDNMTAKELRDLAERATNAANAQEEKEAKIYKVGQYMFDADKKELTYCSFGRHSPSIFTNTRIVDFLSALEKDKSKSNDHELLVGLMNHIIEQKGAR